MKITVALADEVFHAIKKSIFYFKGEAFSAASCKIFIPVHWRMLLTEYLKLQSLTDASLLVFSGVDILPGYEQDKIIISNCGYEGDPSRIQYHTILIIENQVIIKF